MTTYFDIIMIPLQLLIVFFTIYYFTLSFFGLVYRKKDKKVYEEKHTFAMVVCAHNEERVIGALVENLHLLNYSDKLYDIFVVADNCTDKTAEVARKAGAQVHERFNDTEKGKGYAMDWMFNRLFKMERQYDAVCVFDADNLVHPDFLKEMNSRLCNGERLIQGYLDSKILTIPGFQVLSRLLSGLLTMYTIWQNTISACPAASAARACAFPPIFCAAMAGAQPA